MAYDIFHNYDFENGKVNIDTPDFDWALVSCKTVMDSDGFNTEYCWYTNGDKHIFMFGDSDLVEPDEDYADWVCETEQEAKDWFNNYTGFDEDTLETYDEAFTNPSRNFINKGFDRIYTNRVISSISRPEEENHSINFSTKSLRK